MQAYRALPLLLATGLAVTTPSLGQAGGEELSLAALMDIKLQTGSFLELDLSKSPLSMTLIDRTKIRTSGARHLSELLEVYVPGFQYMYNKWGGTIWGMRGVANDRNTKFIFLVNGHKMNAEARDGAFQETDLGLLGDIERVEVLRGPAGLVYGSGAIAGIVNVVTRTSDKDRTEVQADFGTGTNFEQKSWGVDARAFALPAEGQSVAVTLGYRQSSGLGNGFSRLYGSGSWPYPGGGQFRAEGVPTDGSYGATPGNWRTSLDWKWNDIRLYVRATHQVTEAGGFFILDPWPGVSGGPDSTAPNVLIDGRTVTWKDPFWSQTESWSTARREYVADNIAADLSYQVAVGQDQLKFRLGFDGNTDRIQREMRPGYEGYATTGERNSFLTETFGERRYTGGVMYLLRQVPSLQLAAGLEQRFDDIGDDLSGRNSQEEKASHYIVSPVVYSNTAIFTEAFYDINEQLGVDVGARWDGHTRTIDAGGVTNGKLALVYTPMNGHTFKLIAQSSSNNGSGDNYEYGRNSLNDENKPSNETRYERPGEHPGTKSGILYGVTTEDLHSLEPEKVYSLELTSTNQITPELTVSPSVSYSMVENLFAWNQRMFRAINAGSYRHLDLEGELAYTTKMFTVGLNHVYQIPVNTDPNEEAKTLKIGRFTRDSLDGNGRAVKDADGNVIELANYTFTVKDGDTTFKPKQNGFQDYVINPVLEQITADGENFLSLATNTTKFYLDYRPTSWVTLHTDARVFWGLTGRDTLYARDESKGANNWGITRDIMTKLNASALFEMPGNLSVGLFVYNVLGEDNASGGSDNNLAINTLRWQQMGAPDQRDLWAVDLRSYAVTIEKAF